MGRNVLIVDDDPELLNLLGLIARTTGVRAGLAGSGEEALVQLESGHYRKLITDLDMPGIDGFTLARLARVQQPGLEVVLLTGSIMPDLQERAAQAGISRVVAKPVGSDLFIELL